MSDHILKTIADFRTKLERAEGEVIRLKKTINDLNEMAGLPPSFDASALEPESSGAGLAFSSDAFYGKPLATCIKTILERRKASGQGAATIDDIYQLLTSHGYHFEGKEENRKDILRMTLRKNTDFHRLPNNTIGLTAWYDRIKTKSNGDDSESESSTAATDGANNAKPKED